MSPCRLQKRCLTTMGGVTCASGCHWTLITVGLMAVSEADDQIRLPVEQAQTNSWGLPEKGGAVKGWLRVDEARAAGDASGR